MISSRFIDWPLCTTSIAWVHICIGVTGYDCYLYVFLLDSWSTDIGLPRPISTEKVLHTWRVIRDIFSTFVEIICNVLSLRVTRVGYGSSAKMYKQLRTRHSPPHTWTFNKHQELCRSLPSQLGRDPFNEHVVLLQGVVHRLVAFPTILYPVLHVYVML